MKEHIIMDTDIGTDVDDAIALTYLLKAKEHEVSGIATVGGNTQLRAQIASRFLLQLEETVSIVAGHSHSLNGKVGYLSSVEATAYEIDTTQQFPTNVEAWYKTQLEAEPRKSILAIGALTNIASTLMRFPHLENRIAQIYYMGGIDEAAFAKGVRRPNTQSHNNTEDLDAAEYVFGTNIPMVILQKDIPLKHPYPLTEFKERYASHSGIGNLLYAHADEMIKFSKRQNVHLYDPILAAIIGHPESYHADAISQTQVMRELYFDPKSKIEEVVLK